MHTMDKTPKIITIIGLVFEVIGVLGAFLGYWILKNIEDFPGMGVYEADLTVIEYAEFLELMHFLADVILVIGIITAVIVLINLLLFSKLIKGTLTEQGAHKVYLYQAIWGGINLMFNQITGILYLISGVQGYNGFREETDIRTGI